jgi:hypothetical protein
MCGGRCAKCNCTLDSSADLGASNALHVDHVVPRSLHGPDHLSNYQPLCGVCNASKGTRSMIDYRPADVRMRYPPPIIPLPQPNDVTEAPASNTPSADARRAVALMKAHGIDCVSILVARIPTPGLRSSASSVPIAQTRFSQLPTLARRIRKRSPSGWILHGRPSTSYQGTRPGNQ